MGKGVLIIVMATTMAAGVMYMSQSEQMLSQTSKEGDYKDEILARETAVSAYNLIVGKVKRDFDGYRSSYTDLDYGKAKYDISATSAEDGTVTVVATGKYGYHEYEITGSVSKGGGSVLDAVTISSPVSKITLSDNYVISGKDTRADGSAGSGSDVHGILTNVAATYTALLAERDSDQVIGMSGTTDIVQRQPRTDLGTLRSSILNYSGPDKESFSGDQRWDAGDAIGGSGLPKVVLVEGDVELKSSFSGYGVLFVSGTLKMKDDAFWNGIVYVIGSKSRVELKDDARVSGALVMDNSEITDVPAPVDEGDRGLPGGHFDVDVFDEENSTKEIYHEHRYDDKYDVTGVDILSSGCKKPGLCWDQVMGPLNLTEVKIRTINAGNSQGTYRLRVGSTLYTGSSTTPLSLTVDPRNITEFTYNFTALCSLAISRPSQVQDDTQTRNGAITIQVFSTDGSAKLVYELSIYHHQKSGREDSCTNEVLNASETAWVNASGDTYSGDDEVCVSEDDNDNYTDATARQNKWGNRKERGGEATKSKKSKKSKDLFWSENGSCSRSDTGSPSEAMQFSMKNNASIVYNSRALKRLKDMFERFDLEDNTPVARRIRERAELKTSITNDTRKITSLQ